MECGAGGKSTIVAQTPAVTQPQVVTPPLIVAKLPGVAQEKLLPLNETRWSEKNFQTKLIFVVLKVRSNHVDCKKQIKRCCHGAH